MTCRLFITMSLSKPMMTHWTIRDKLQWNFNQNITISFLKMHLKMSSAKWRKFISPSAWSYKVPVKEQYSVPQLHYARSGSDLQSVERTRSVFCVPQSLWNVVDQFRSNMNILAPTLPDSIFCDILHLINQDVSLSIDMVPGIPISCVSDSICEIYGKIPCHSWINSTSQGKPTQHVMAFWWRYRRDGSSRIIVTCVFESCYTNELQGIIYLRSLI